MKFFQVIDHVVKIIAIPKKVNNLKNNIKYLQIKRTFVTYDLLLNS